MSRPHWHNGRKGGGEVLRWYVSLALHPLICGASFSKGDWMVPVNRSATMQSRSFSVVSPSTWNWLPVLDILRLLPNVTWSQLHQLPLRLPSSACPVLECLWIGALKGYYISFYRFIDWIIDCLCDFFSFHWLILWLIQRLMDWFFDWLIDSLIDRLFQWLLDWYCDWLILCLI